MNFKKFIAAASAITMLGTLAAVPSFAITTQETVLEANADTEWKFSEVNGGTVKVGDTTLTSKNITAKGASVTLMRSDSGTNIGNPVQARLSQAINFEANTTCKCRLYLHNY